MARRPPATSEIAAYRGAHVTCLLYADGTEDAVAVVFPGAAREGNRVGGTPARPDLHYTRELLQLFGTAVFEVWWDAATAPVDDLDGWLDAHVAAALEVTTQERRLAAVAGRSLGTLALARLVTGPGWSERPVPSIWIAPLLDEPGVADALSGLGAPAFVVGGSEDESFDVERAEGLRRPGIDLVVVPGADHALEVDDPARSARLLAEALDRMREFLERELAAR